MSKPIQPKSVSMMRSGSPLMISIPRTKTMAEAFLLLPRVLSSLASMKKTKLIQEVPQSSSPHIKPSDQLRCTGNVPEVYDWRQINIDYLWTAVPGYVQGFRGVPWENFTKGRYISLQSSLKHSEDSRFGQFVAWPVKYKWYQCHCRYHVSPDGTGAYGFICCSLWQFRAWYELCKKELGHIADHIKW